jgi:hypothetical protein
VTVWWMVVAFLRCPSGLVSNKLGSPPFKGMKVPDVLDVSHFGRVQDFLASGGRAKPPKIGWPRGPKANRALVCGCEKA